MTKTTILLLILVAFAQPTFCQEVQRFDLQNTTGYNFLLKAVQPDESTLVIFRKQPSKGPGGYQVIADVINDNGVKRIVVSTPKELGMQIKDVFALNNEIVVIGMHISKVDKKEVYTAHFLDLKTGNIGEPTELARQQILPRGLVRNTMQFACSPNQQYLSVFHPTERKTTEKYSINISTFDSRLKKISTVTEDANFFYYECRFKQLILDNKGQSHLLFADFTKAQTKFTPMETSPFTQYGIYSYNDTGKLNDGIYISNLLMNQVTLSNWNDDKLLLFGLQSISAKEKYASNGFLAYSMTPKNGDSELILDAKLSGDYFNQNVLGKDNVTKTGGLKGLEEPKIIIHNNDKFSITTQAMHFGSESVRYTDILVTTYTPDEVNTYLIPRNNLKSKADFTNLNGEIVGIMFQSDETFYQQDLLLLTLGEALEKKKLLSRAESIEIRDGLHKLFELEHTKTIILFAQTSNKEARIYKITMK